MKRKNVAFIIGFGCGLPTLVLFAVILIFNIKLDPDLGSVRIAEVFTTTGIDDNGLPLPSTTQFSSKQPRIYCAVAINSSKPVRVGIRWYYENELIYEDQDIIESGWVFYIQPLPGERFEEGNYHIEIYLVREAVETIYFTVGP